MLNRYSNLTYVVVVVVVVVLVGFFMMLMKWLHTVIIMVQIVNIFCSPPHLFFYIISVPMKNYTNIPANFGSLIGVTFRSGGLGRSEPPRGSRVRGPRKI